MQAVIQLLKEILAALLGGGSGTPLSGIMPADAPTYAPAASAAGGVVAGVPATLWSIYGNSGAEEDLWLMTFDAVAVPPNGEPPIDVVQIPRAGSGQAAVVLPRAYAVGVAWAASTTRETLTQHAGAPLLVRARYTA